MIAPFALARRLARDLTRPDPVLWLATAEHAAAVYLDRAGYEAAVVGAGYSGCALLSRGAAQCGIADHEDVIVVSIRGTSERLDWRSNLRAIWRRPWTPYLPPDCRVGWGWRQQAEALIEPLVLQLAARRRLHPDAALVVTGHSLGAAGMWLLVPALTRRGYPPRVAVGHGSPRVGNQAWADWYNGTFDARLAHEMRTGFTPADEVESLIPSWSIALARRGSLDAVTRVPPRRWPWSCHHVGRRVVIADGEMLGFDAWRRLQGRNPVGHLAAWRKLSRLAAGVGSHPMAGAVEALKQLTASPAAGAS
jgi:hypothetical protein